MEEEAVGLVQYESAYGHVKLSADTVINYLAKGKTKLTEQEAVLPTSSVSKITLISLRSQLPSSRLSRTRA